MKDKKDNATFELPGMGVATLDLFPAEPPARPVRPRQRRILPRQEQLELLEETDATGLPVWKRDDNLDLTGLPIWAQA